MFYILTILFFTAAGTIMYVSESWKKSEVDQKQIQIPVHTGGQGDNQVIGCYQLLDHKLITDYLISAAGLLWINMVVTSFT